MNRLAIKGAALLAGLAALPAPASAQAMNAQAFYERAAALKAAGPLAPLLQPAEVKLLIDEAKAAGAAAEAMRTRAIKAKRRPRYCPPAAAPKIGAEQFFTMLEAIPAAQRRRITMTEAVNRMMARDYPCPAPRARRR